MTTQPPLSANGHQAGHPFYPQPHPSPERVRLAAAVVLAAEVITWLYRDALKELED